MLNIYSLIQREKCYKQENQIFSNKNSRTYLYWDEEEVMDQEGQHLETAWVEFYPAEKQQLEKKTKLQTKLTLHTIIQKVIIKKFQ